MFILYQISSLFLQQETLQNYKLATANVVMSSDMVIGLHEVENPSKGKFHSL